MGGLLGCQPKSDKILDEHTPHKTVLFSAQVDEQDGIKFDFPASQTKFSLPRLPPVLV